MAYATAQQLIDHIGEGAVVALLDDDSSGDIGTAETTLLTRYVEEASRIVDRALAVHWSLPISETSTDLADWTLHLAAELLYSRHGQVPPAVSALAELARADLDRVRQGVLRITGLTYPGDGFTRERHALGRPVVANPGQRLRRLF